MPRPCSLCESPHSKEVLRRLKGGQPHDDIVLFLGSVGVEVHRTTVGRHAKHALPEVRRTGPRPPGASFLEDVEANAWDDMALGLLRPTIRDAIGARAELNKQSARFSDRDLMMKIALAMTGHSLIEARVIDPEREALEAEFQKLLPSGDDERDAFAEVDAQRLRAAQG
jgi:hypothetical protein